MSEIQPFVFPTTGHAVRTLLLDDEPWVVATDVCAVLGIANVSDAMGTLDEDEKTQVKPNLVNSKVGGGRDPWIINEPGLYSLILRSRKPEAKAFKRWVTHEVLPSIRKTGAYSMSTPVRIELTINALAELAHNEHVVPMAGRVLAFKRWRKPHDGIKAFVQLAIDLNLPGIDGGTATKALPK